MSRAVSDTSPQIGMLSRMSGLLFVLTCALAALVGLIVCAIAAAMIMGLTGIQSDNTKALLGLSFSALGLVFPVVILIRMRKRQRLNSIHDQSEDHELRTPWTASTSIDQVPVSVDGLRVGAPLSRNLSDGTSAPIKTEQQNHRWIPLWRNPVLQALLWIMLLISAVTGFRYALLFFSPLLVTTWFSPHPIEPLSKMRKWATTAIAFMLLVAALAIGDIPYGNELPNCDSSQTQRAVKDMIENGPNSRLVNIRVFAIKAIKQCAWKEDKENTVDRRACSGILYWNGGQEEIMWEIWRDEGKWWVETSNICALAGRLPLKDWITR
jgi:hypothetical protein